MRDEPILRASNPLWVGRTMRTAMSASRPAKSSVRVVRMGSAPLSQSLIDAAQAVFPKALVANAYGTTEAGPVVFGPHPKGLKQPSLSPGYPHSKVELRLVRDGKVVEDDHPEGGVLEMKCGALMTRYHKLPEATAKVMTPDGFYRTGDVFRRDADGFHYFIGRTDDMFNSGGENIYPGDVERMLETHADVSQAAVVPIDDDIKGQKPVAFIIAKAGRHPSVEEIKQYALANAPAYQHPRRIWFLDQMLLASTNKIDRAALQQRAAETIKGA